MGSAAPPISARAVSGAFELRRIHHAPAIVRSHSAAWRQRALPLRRACRPANTPATDRAPGTRLSRLQRETSRGSSRKFSYPRKSSSPPTPDTTTLSPCSATALLAYQVLMPSMLGWSIDSRMRGRSAMNSSRPTSRM